MHYLEKQLHQTANHLGWKFDQFAAEYNLTGQQLSTIDFLANQPDWQSTQHAIEVEFNIKRSTTTKMLQRLEKRFSPQELAIFEQILAYLQEKSDVGETNGKNQ